MASSRRARRFQQRQAHRRHRMRLERLEERRVLNAAPVLDDAASPTLGFITEDAAAPAGAVGTLVSSLVDSNGPLSNFSDAAGDLPGIAITGVNLQGGVLWFSEDGGTTWLDVGAVSEVNPRLLAADADNRLYYQPAADFSGTVSDVISFKAWDRRTMWQQLGLDIDAEAPGDQSGWSVSLSANGQTVAIGATGNDGTSTDAGHVRIYHWTGATWQQLGLDINGETANDNSGYSVSLSADGQTVAIGAVDNDGTGSNAGHVRIYHWTGATWQQLGLDIDGEAANDYLGYSVSLSADGQTVAIGATGNDGTSTDAGHVRIYRWTGSTWQQLGLDIDGAPGDQSGSSVSLSADGRTVAIGAVLNDGTGGLGSDAGLTRIYRWTGSMWQLEAEIDGEATHDQSGSSVSLSADGQTVAIGAPYSDDNGSNAGHVRIYHWTGATWQKLGTDIDGEAPGDRSGYSVSLSADGQTVAIGAHYNDGNGTVAGHVRIYRWTGSMWQLEAEKDGEAAGDRSGYSVSLSAGGQTVAIGSYLNDGNGASAGHVRIYQLTADASSLSTVTDTISVTVEPVNDAPTLDASTGVTILEDAAQQTVNLSGISAGGGESQPLRVTATSSNTGLIPNPTVAYTSPNGTGSLAFTPAADQHGTATITVTVEDGGLDGDLATTEDNHTFARTVDVLVKGIAPSGIPLEAQPAGNWLHSSGSGPSQSSTWYPTRLSDVPTLSEHGYVTYYIAHTEATGWIVPTEYASPYFYTYETYILSDVDQTIDYFFGGNDGHSLFINDEFVLGAGFGITPESTLDLQAGVQKKLLLVSFNSGGDTGINFAVRHGGDVVVIEDVPGITLSAVPFDRLPQLDPLSKRTIAEDAAEQLVVLTGISSGQGESQPVAVTATSSNTTLIPDPTVTYASPNGTGSLAFTPTADQHGTATITVMVEDGGLDGDLATAGDNATFSRTFDVTVTPVNDEPTLDVLASVTILEDATGQESGLAGISAGGSETQPLRVTATSSNTALIPNPTVTYASPDSTGSIAFTPVADQHGTATITVTVEDGGLDGDLATTADNATFSRTFDVTVTPVNDEPTLDVIASVAFLEDAAVQTVNLAGISAGAGETQPLRVTATSSNTGLIPDPTVTYASPDVTGSIAFTPVADQHGTATITVTVEDSGLDEDLATADDNATFTQMFNVVVTPVNDRPLLDVSASVGLEAVPESAAAPVGAVGTLVSSLIDSGGALSNFSDADGDLPGIAITSVNLEGGTLWYSTDNGANWQDVAAVSPSEARTLYADSETRLYFEPDQSFSEEAGGSFSFRAWDRNGDAGNGNAGVLATSTLSLVSSYDPGGFLWNAAISSDETRLYVTDEWTGHLRILDITNPLSPVQLGQFYIGLPMRVQVTADAGIIYVTNRSGETAAALTVLDVTDPRNPVSVGSLPKQEGESGFLTVLDEARNRAFLSHTKGLDILDITDIRNPARIQTLPRSAVGTQPYPTLGIENLLYLSSRGEGVGLVVLEEVDGQYEVQNSVAALDGYYRKSIVLSGDELWVFGSLFGDVNNHVGGIAVFDVSNPVAPVLTEVMENGFWSHATLVSNNTQIYASKDSALGIFETGSGLPAAVHYVSLAGEGKTITTSVDGEMVYVASGSAGLQVFEVTDHPVPFSMSFGLVSVPVAYEPDDISITSSVVAENSAAGTRVGNLATADKNSADSFTYTLVSGVGDTGNASFEIVGNELRTTGVFDYEVQDAYSVRVRSTDSAGLYVEKYFVVSVGDVNDNPALSALFSITILEDAAEQVLSLSGISAGGGETQPLRVTATSSNTELIPDPSVTYTSTDATGSLAFTPVADQHGTATITVTVEDGGLDGDLATAGDNATFSQTFDVTVYRVNDAPTLYPAISPQLDSVLEDAGLPVGAVGTSVASFVKDEGPDQNFCG